MSIPVRVIAGQHSGIPVTIDANLYPLFESMATLAKGGSHWASLAVRQLSALSSGHFKKNVYIQCNGRLDEFGEYTVILPGCKASFRKNASGAFYIYALEADLNYGSLQKSELKPGLYQVSKVRDSWAAKYVGSGQIKERKINVVVISDQRHELDSSVVLANDAITDSGRPSGDIASNGFDMHFTYGKHSIGGLRNLSQAMNPASSPELHESSILLAETMRNAQKIKDVTWVSERGGSGVLTQAMRILKDNGVNFEGSGHRAFFSHVQTNLGDAEQLARQLRLGFDGKTHSRDWYNLNERLGSGALSGFINPIKRRKSDNKYSTLNCISDIGKEAGAWSGAVATTIAAPAAIKSLGAAAVAMGASVAATSGAGLMFAAVTASYAAYKSAKPIYKGATAVVSSYFPLASHKKLTGK